jgi:mRNA-degrading endonuclease RelE of RelBE toxin-antitoxin system
MATDKRLVQIRLTPKVHEELKRLSKVQRRSLANMVEVIVVNEIAAIRKSTEGMEGGDIILDVHPAKTKDGDKKASGKRVE